MARHRLDLIPVAVAVVKNKVLDKSLIHLHLKINLASLIQ